MPSPVRVVHVLTTQLTGTMTYRAAHVVDSGLEVVRVTLTDSYLETTARLCVSNLQLKVNKVFWKLEKHAFVLWNTWTVNCNKCVLSHILSSKTLIMQYYYVIFPE